jgi:biopolymer transport protein ExbD
MGGAIAEAGGCWRDNNGLPAQALHRPISAQWVSRQRPGRLRLARRREFFMAAKLAQGGGGKKFDLGQNSDINVTPFVDVMLVLLIIFMVAAPLATVSIRIDLPPAKPPPPNQKDEKPPTYISIQDTGQIFVSFGKTDIRPSSMDNLERDLAASLGVADYKNERVFIRADRHVRYRQFMDVINRLQTLGFYKIGLIAENLD